MTATNMYSTPVVRLYVDTRALVSQGNGNSKDKKSALPLLSSLPQDIQDKVTRFIRVEDRYMSLASALLKFFFVHRTARVPWSSIQISTTPKPHGRPFWDPPASWHGDDFDGLEFNVSHQAGMIILAGCRTPSRPSESSSISQQGTSVTPDPAQQQQPQIRVGVDVTCTKEPRRTPDLTTQPKLDEWVDTFAEMFSQRERGDMKTKSVPDATPTSPQSWVLEQKARRFYTYWALKEAYIKMVGEGLLADWLRQLEFINVIAPDNGERLSGDELVMKTLFKGRDISSTIHVELEGMQDTFLFTMMTRGINEENQSSARWVRLDIDRDIRSCAEGTCSCLNS